MSGVRVLHLVSSLNVGGAERFAIDLAVAQRDEGAEVGVLSFGQPDEPLVEEVNRLDIPVFFSDKHSLLKRWLKLKAVFARYDIVHVHTSYSLPLLSLLMPFSRARFIYTRHNMRVMQSLKWRCVYWLASRLLHKVAFVAEGSRADFVSHYPAFAGKSEAIHNGVLPLPYQFRAGDKLRLGSVGRLEPLKAQHFLLEAVGQLTPEQQARLDVHFFGVGPEMDKLKTLAQNLPDTQVVFHGFVKNREAIYPQFDVLVMCSETEGLSLAILESLSAGLPVVASDVGGNKELVRHGENGYLYPYADTQQLADTIAGLLDNISLRETLSIQAAKTAKQHFSMQACAQKYLALYQ